MNHKLIKLKSTSNINLKMKNLQMFKVYSQRITTIRPIEIGLEEMESKVGNTDSNQRWGQSFCFQITHVISLVLTFLFHLSFTF
jgi:hypothetical protein